MNVKNYHWTIAKLQELKAKIDPRPQYQRGSVWNEPDRQLLIDSILQGFDIPKIYLRKVDTLAYEYEVADGQQRLRAIWEYLDDTFSIADDCPVTAAAGVNFSGLTAALRRKIRDFKLSVAVAYNASSSEIRELFVRLQRGVTLSQPEIRNAMPSQLGDTIRGMATTHPFCTSGPFSSDRYQTDDLVAHAFLVESTAGDRDMKAPNLRALYKEHEKGIDQAVVTHVMEVLDVLHQMQVARPRCISRKWGFVDVYWVVSTLMREGKKPDPAWLATRYVAFERRRLESLSEPGKLVEGKPSRADRALFDYIEAFKTSAGVASHLAQRHRVLLGVLSATS